MSDMNIRALLGRGRELLGRMRPGEATAPPLSTFSLLALRLERDLHTPDKKGHVILVTAADDDAVGVEATMELAWCLAEDLGHLVLVVDGAFDVRALSAALGLAERQGLAELLDVTDEDSLTFQSALQPTLHERIKILPHGTSSDHAIRADSLRQLLATARSHFDFVLVQGSVLVDGSRSMAFTSLVDAALLIAVEEKTRLEEVTRAQRLLNDCGATRVALVLANRPRPRRPNGR